MQYIGIDAAKSSFVVGFPQDQGYITATYDNYRRGIESFLHQLDQSSHHYVLEATGNYGGLLVEMIVSAEIAV